MRFRIFGAQILLVGILFLLLLCPSWLLAQNPSGGVRGQVSDPSGAAVPSAKVAAVSSTGQSKLGVVHSDGSYEIKVWPPEPIRSKPRAQGFTYV